MKLRNKLILSCAALAAVATTAVSTTFAWYTTNTEVQALNASGASADAGNSSIFISGDGEHWWSKVDTQSSIETQKFTVTQVDLTPVAYKGVNGGNEVWVDQKSQATTAVCVSFDLYFKVVDAEADTDIAIKTITIANTTGSVKTKTNYLTGTEYSVDFRNALAMVITGDGVASGINANGYSLTPGQGIVSGTGSAYTTTSPLPASGSAHNYVNQVSGEGTVTETDSSVTPLAANTKIATLPQNENAVKLTFKVYLDGADVDCYDACQGQQFNMNMVFKVLE